MILDEELIIGKNINDLRANLGVSVLDILWFVGSTNYRLTGEKGDAPISDPTVSILIRLLDKHPELSFLPKFPDAQEIFELLQQYFPGKMTYRKFGTILGSTGWSGKQWGLGATPAPIGQRLFYLVKRIMEEMGGKEGLAEYLKIVEIEAKVRGIGTLKDLLKKGSWGKGAFLKKHQSS